MDFDGMLISNHERKMVAGTEWALAAEEAADESVGSLESKTCPACGSRKILLDNFDDDDWKWRCERCSNGWIDDDLVTPEDVILNRREAAAEAMAEARAEALMDEAMGRYPI